MELEQNFLYKINMVDVLESICFEFFNIIKNISKEEQYELEAKIKIEYEEFHTVEIEKKTEKYDSDDYEVFPVRSGRWGLPGIWYFEMNIKCTKGDRENYEKIPKVRKRLRETDSKLEEALRDNINNYKSYISYLLKSGYGYYDKKDYSLEERDKLNNSQFMKNLRSKYYKCSLLKKLEKEVEIKNIKIDLIESLDVLSTMRYEGAVCKGNIVIVEDKSIDELTTIKFKEKVSIKESRKIRKILEMTDDDMALITDSNYVFGLGKVSKDICRAVVRFKKEGTYSISLNNLNYKVEYGNMKKEEEENWVDKLRRHLQLFNDKCIKYKYELKVDKIIDLAKSASKQKHGTMLVISCEAEEESKRLKNESISIEKNEITTDLIKNISSIDGSIIIDPLGYCYGIGVILDGTAGDGLGTSDRGARYNSAIKYVNSNKDSCLIIVISEDSMVDIIDEHKLKDIKEKEA